MNKIVLDTNVVVSAFWSKNGNAHRIIDLVIERQIILCYNEDILKEYQDVLSREKFKFSATDVYNFINDIKLAGLHIKVVASTFEMVDETDRVFFDVATVAKAILITGNTKHFPKADIIFTPKSFLELYENL